MFRWQVKTGGSRALEGTPHIHVHFLNGVEFRSHSHLRDRFEICCHGCGVGQIVQYDLLPGDQLRPLSANLEVDRFRKDFQRLHADCTRFIEEEDCPLVRSVVTSMDLRENPSRDTTDNECDCPCHWAPVEHEDPCCHHCPKCGRDIQFACVDEHNSWCLVTPDTKPEGPASKRDPFDDAR